MHRDLDNLIAAPLDLLIKTGVILDDYLVESLDGTRKYVDADNPRMEIFVKPFTSDSTKPTKSL